MAASSGAPAGDGPVPSQSGVEMAVQYPATGGVRIPAPDSEVVGLDASKLFDVIAKMGESIAKIQDELQVPPPWVADVSEKLKRMDKLDRGFSSLTDVVGNLMTVANVTDGQTLADLSAVRTKTAKTKDEEGLATPDPFAIQQFNGLRSQLEAFERKMAAAPAYEDVEQLKDYVHERTKKLKATLVTLQGAMERKFDTKMKEHLEGFDKWQADLMEVTAGRLRVLEDQIKETNVEFDDFREVNGSELHDVQDSTRANKEWCTREFSSCNAQTLNLQVMIHKVVERVDALEKGAEARQVFIEKLARNIQEKLEHIDKRETNSKQRADGVDEKLVLLEEGFKKNNEETVDNKHGIEKMFKRLEWQDGRIAEETLKISNAEKDLKAVTETVENVQITQAAEREERCNEIKTVRSTALARLRRTVATSPFPTTARVRERRARRFLLRSSTRRSTSSTRPTRSSRRTSTTSPTASRTTRTSSSSWRRPWRSSRTPSSPRPRCATSSRSRCGTCRSARTRSRASGPRRDFDVRAFVPEERSPPRREMRHDRERRRVSPFRRLFRSRSRRTCRRSSSAPRPRRSSSGTSS